MKMFILCCNVLTFGMKMNINAMQKIHICNGDLSNDLDYTKCEWFSFQISD
jgi:hypothetical protein